jgi:uncharacterized membrane protein
MSPPHNPSELPVEGGFRMRGTDMTRLETFTDAAFAFAITLLVVVVGELPTTYAELLDAIKAAPAFLVSFALMMMFWHGHRVWSRRYGLEDTTSTLASLALVFVILLYIYPLRLMSAGLASFLSGGHLPSEFRIQKRSELTGLFVIYGIGFAAMAGLLAVLHLHALRRRTDLGLNEFEELASRYQMMQWWVMAATGVVSALWAGLMPPRLGVWAGMIYSSLAVIMPVFSRTYGGRLRRLRQG